MNATCGVIRGELAETLLLRRPLTAALSRHIAECGDCAREVGEIAAVVATLEHADTFPSAAETAGSSQRSSTMPAGLGDRIGRRVRAAGTTRRHRWLAVFAAAATLICGLALVPTLTSQDQPPPTGVELAREGWMIPHPWGTEVPVSLSGLRVGQTYHLLTEDAEGHRVPAGSVRAETEQPVRTSMITAMSRESIVGLLVADQQGRQVAKILAASPFPTGAAPRPTTG